MNAFFVRMYLGTMDALVHWFGWRLIYVVFSVKTLCSLVSNKVESFPINIVWVVLASCKG